MDQNQAIQFIRHPRIVGDSATVWAEFGSGQGIFTTALASLLGKDSYIYAIDKNPGALKKIRYSGQTTIRKMEADFILESLPLPPLDGIMMANSIHYVSDKMAFLKKTAGYLKPEACFLIVEYDRDTANPWVPYPLSFRSLKTIFKEAGFGPLKMLYESPSLFNNGNMYSVIVEKSAALGKQ